MHVTVCLAGHEDVDVDVGEACRSLRALKEAIVEALPQLCAEWFDVSVGGRALDDEGVVSLEPVRLDVAANTRGLSVLTLRDAGHEVSEDGLLEAAEGGDVALCKLYLDAGVPLDCVELSGDTPLHLSCEGEHLEVTTLLLDRGSTAIDAKNGHDWTPLLFSCHRGDLEVVTLLLDRGSTAIDEANVDDNTPLHLSCLGHLELATLLLDRGSTAIDAKNCDGVTPLHLSCRGHLEIATLLLDRGSTAINAKDRRGNTPLHAACGGGHLEMATFLLDRGTAIDAKDRRGATPLHHSCSAGRLALATLLLDRGSTAIDAKDRRGKTPLHGTWRPEVATFLLDRGASVDIEQCAEAGTFGPSPYFQEVLDVLSQRGNNVVPGESAKRRRIGKQ